MCLAKIASLEEQMAAINDKNDEQWKKLRMQKIAQNARLRHR